MEPIQVNLQQLLDQAVQLHQKGNLAAAEALYLRLLEAEPSNSKLLVLLGMARAQSGRPQDALDAIATAVTINPEDAEGWLAYGNALRAVGRSAEAIGAYDRAISRKPNYADAIFNQACAFLEAGQPAKALTGFDQTLRLYPDFAGAWGNRGFTLNLMGRFSEALAAYDKLLTLTPNDPDGLSKRGIALWNMNRRNEALQSFDKAVMVRSDFIEGWVNLANGLRNVKRLDEALAACERALALSPDYIPALHHRGIALWEMNRLDEALASYNRALYLQPDNSAVLNDRGVTLRELKRLDEALADFDRVLVLNPNFTGAVYNRANVLADMERLDEAIAEFERTLALDPNDPRALSGMADAALNLCDWERTAKIAEELSLARDKMAVSPLVLIQYGVDPELQLHGTRNFLKERVPPELMPFPPRKPSSRNKIRLAYLSSDFIRHPVAYQIAGLIEHHDRSRFEVIGISFGRDDKSDIRARLIKGFDSFHDVKDRSSRAIAELVRELEVDIAVDLCGHTQGSRPDIFAYRPAPVQVSYLGFPGTMGANFIDYVIGDPIVLPMSDQAFHDEKIVQLPDTFWVSETTRPLGTTPTRSEVGLPETGFVFCSFNKQPKITAEMWDLWMRLLKAVPDSVLWLKYASNQVRAKLGEEAKRRGVDPARLIFAPPLDSMEQHLARHRVADLMLDTLPYNAHATASDALWAGLPVLTCRGHAFAGRVAASMLTAIGLPELITDSLEAYETMALRLAREPELLQSLRARLEKNRLSTPLFDAERFRRNIEAAYMQMWAAHGTIAEGRRS